MEPTRILQIVPGFYPDVDGLGDYARILGAKLAEAHGIVSHFLVYWQPARKPDQTPDQKPDQKPDAASCPPNTVSWLAEPTPSALLEEVSRLTQGESYRGILLHYGPYSYSRDGLPGRFVEACRALAERLPLITFFHENWPTVPPWRRTFYIAPLQRLAATRLTRLSTVAVTSGQYYARRMAGCLGPGQSFELVGIFSNLGEASEPLPLSQRSRTLVITGQGPSRRRFYQGFEQEFKALVRMMRPDKILDIGPGDVAVPRVEGDVQPTRLGFRSDSEVSALLSEAQIGVVCLPPQQWEKSGVLAALQAHGVAPILFSRQRNAPAYYKELPFVRFSKTLTTDQIEGSALDAIGLRAWRLYQEQRSTSMAASRIAALVYALR